MIGNFLINLFAGIVVFVFGYFFPKMQLTFQTRNVKYLWKHFFKRKNVKVVLSTRLGPYQRSTPRVSILEMKGFVILSNLLTRFKFVLEPRSSEDKLTDLKDEDLIILGGPAANKISLEIWNNLSSKLPCLINLDEQKITIADRIYKPLYDVEGCVQTDYAIVLRTKHPYNMDRTIFLCFGCHGFGTLGAVNMITNDTKVRTIEKRIKSDDFILFCKIDFKNQKLIDTNIVESYSINHI